MAKFRQPENNDINIISQLQVLGELKKSNFTLLNQTITFDENGDPKFGSYSIVFWNGSGDAEEIGFYHFPNLSTFFINNTKIVWYTNGEVGCWKKKSTDVIMMPCDLLNICVQKW